MPSPVLPFVLWAQRHAGVVPAPARRILRRAVGPGRRAGSGVLAPPEDWSIPLIPGRGGGDLAEVLPVTVAASAPNPAAGAPTVRCVVATDVLDVGGMDEFVGFLGRWLPSAGVETVVVYASKHQAGTSGEGGRAVRALEATGTRTVELSPATAKAWLADHRPGVVSAHGAPDWLLAAAVELGVPWVETLHGMHAFLDPSTWQPEAVRARGIAAHIAVSELVRRQYLAHVPGADPKRVVTIPNGVDGGRIRRVDRARARQSLGLADEYLFVSLARYGLQKNVYGLVSAFAEVAARHPEAHLLVAGRADDEPYYAQVRRLVDELPCADRIHLRGHCGNPSALLAAADGFVLDSFFEGWPLASMEALTLGTPVVSSDVGGAREQLGAGGRGYLVPNPGGVPERVDWRRIGAVRFRRQGNRTELVAAMSALVRDRATWAAERERLASEAAEAFPADRCVRRHAAVLAQVARGEPPALPDDGG